MEKPSFSPAPPSPPGGPADGRPPPPPLPPTPEELVAHFESQGMDQREASLKTIRLLQDALLHQRSAPGGPRRGAFPGDPDAQRRLDAVGLRLKIVEAKLDSKPGFAGAFTVGVAAGVAAKAVAAGAVEVWTAVRNLNKRHG